MQEEDPPARAETRNHKHSARLHRFLHTMESACNPRSTRCGGHTHTPRTRRSPGSEQCASSMASSVHRSHRTRAPLMAPLDITHAFRSLSLSLSLSTLSRPTTGLATTGLASTAPLQPIATAAYRPAYKSAVSLVQVTQSPPLLAHARHQATIKPPPLFYLPPLMQIYRARARAPPPLDRLASTSAPPRSSAPPSGTSIRHLHPAPPSAPRSALYSALLGTHDSRRSSGGGGLPGSR